MMTVSALQKKIFESMDGMKTKVEEIKYSGPGGGHRRKLVDDHEEQLTSSTTRLERCPYDAS